MAYLDIKKKFFKSIIIGVLIGLVFYGLFLFLTAFLIVKGGSIPYSYISPLIMVMTGFGSLVGGFTAGKIFGKNGVILGAISGLIIFFLLLITSFSFMRMSLTFTTSIRLLVTIISGIIGGIIGVNKA